MASSSEKFPYTTDFDVKDFVPKMLHEGQYKKWSSLMEDFIDRRGLKGFIDGTAIDEVRNDHDVMAWRRSDKLVQAWILATVSDEIRLRVRSMRNAQDLWLGLGYLLDPTTWRREHDEEEVKGGNILHKAVIEGDWKTAMEIIEKDPTAITASITTFRETLLIVTVQSSSAGRDGFLEKLLPKLEPEDVKQVDSDGSTALHYAALLNNIEAAKLLVDRDRELPNAFNRNHLIPLQSAAWCGHRQMVLYLMAVTEPEIRLRDDVAPALFAYLISSELYDIASYLLQKKPGLALADMDPMPFAILAEKHSSFPSGTSLDWWERLIYWGVPTRSERHTIAELIAQGGDAQNVATANGCLSVRQRLHLLIQGVAKNLGVLTRSRSESNIADVEAGRGSRSGSGRGDIQNAVANCRISVMQTLHFMIWEIAIKLVPSVKHIQEKRETQHHALQLVKQLCREVAKSNRLEVEWIYKIVLRKAVRDGIPDEIIQEIASSYPLALIFKTEDSVNFIKYAILYRRERVFNLIHEVGAGWRCITGLDELSNSSLHLAACLGRKQQINLKASAAGAILHMQREMQWFQEVHKFTQPFERGRRNSDGMTPLEVFYETHQDLVRDGEQWMKKRAESCTIVAALIAGMVFAAAITVPGGNDNVNGHPILLKRKAFMVFGVADALALFSSITSVLMFLLILNSRYAEQDFLHTLPRRLIIGLISLFASILSMMIAFSAILYLVFGGNEAWILIPIVVLASIPAIFFGALQFPLLIEMIQSTYGRGLFGKQSNRPRQD